MAKVKLAQKKNKHKDIYKKFCKWSPEHANMVVEYKPWGSNSIIVWLRNGLTYKVKQVTENAFVMQPISEEDIKRKLECQ